MSNEVKFNSEARDGILRGVNILADAVATTLGPKGRNVAIMRPYGPPHVTKDGVTVAKEINLKDPMENMGAQLIKEAARKTADVAGDGTTTATVLARAIAVAGTKSIAAGMNPMDLKRGIDKAVTHVVDYIETASQEITTQTEVAQVGTISANGEKEIGDMIAQAMDEVGAEGVITVEEAKGFDMELETVTGMRFDRGYLSPFFSNNTVRMISEYEDAIVLLYDGKISALQEMLPILEQVVQTSKPFLIIAEDVEGEALATLVVNVMRQGLKVVAIKAPGFGDSRKAMMEDLCTLTGGTLVGPTVGIKLESATLEMLGSVKNLTITKDTSTLVGGGGTIESLNERIESLRVQIEETEMGYDRDKLQERLAKLAGGIGVIRVGGATEIEVKERKDRVDDALAATQAAVEEGIVPGGGMALYRALQSITELTGDNNDQDAGIGIVRSALQKPFETIVDNAGDDVGMTRAQLESNRDIKYGYNAQTAEFVDMIEAGIIDPAKVVRSALQNAASVAGLILTTEAAIIDIPAESGAPQQPGMMM